MKHNIPYVNKIFHLLIDKHKTNIRITRNNNENKHTGIELIVNN